MDKNMIFRHMAINVVHESIYEMFSFSKKETSMTQTEKQLLKLNKAITQKLKKLPIVDAVEVVRCKDCRFWDGECCAYFMTADENGFCYWGERREE